VAKSEETTMKDAAEAKLLEMLDTFPLRFPVVHPRPPRLKRE
jgi:hypothetical protein